MSNIPPELCEHCVKGVRHEGTPEGKFEEIEGIKCYIATPSEEYPRDQVILFLTDIFGIDLYNNQLLADDYARNGYKVVMPNLFKEALHEDALNPGSSFDIGAWFGVNGPHVGDPIARKLVAALKATGITKIAAVGYCYGARLLFNLAFDGEIHVVAVSHPSLLKVPDDIETYLAKSKAPLLINSCPVDTQFPQEAQAKTDAILGEGKFAPGYKRTYWEGCTHGFAVRGDLNDPKVKAGKEGAFKANVEWIKAHL